MSSSSVKQEEPPCSCAGDLPVLDSQGSQLSCLSLDLSQDTVARVLDGIGLSTTEGDRYVHHFLSALDVDEDGECPVSTVGGPSTSTLSMTRAVIHARPSVMLPSWSQPPPPPLAHASSFTLSHPHPGNPPPCTNGSLCVSPVTPTTLLPSSTTASPHPHSTTPLSSYSYGDNLTPAQLTPVSPHITSQHSLVGSLAQNFPANFPKVGEYGFQYLFPEEGQKFSKSTSSTYSSAMRRLYVKASSVLTFKFTFSKLPPEGSILRALPVHKQAERLGESIICCPKHVHNQQKQGILFPQHFVRSPSQSCEYVVDQSKRYSIITPVSALLKQSTKTYSMLYEFPCNTSHVTKQGQHVELLFTLECMQVVLGRCTVDIRVCASPGRDRMVDEEKLREKDRGAETGHLATGQKTRKRPAGSTDLVQCTLPPKQLCMGLSGEKVDHTIKTYPELIPYVMQSINMLEQLYSVRVVPTPPVIEGGGEAVENNGEYFTTLEGWLKHLQLEKYLATLNRNGIHDLHHIADVDDKELKEYGISTVAHRKRFLEGKKLLPLSQLQRQETDEEEKQSQEFLDSSLQFLSGSQPGSQPFLSQFSSSSGSTATQPFSTPATFEVLQIKVVKETLSDH